jgi:hypothetical protein
MRYATGAGTPTKKEWWQGNPLSPTDNPHQKFLKDNGFKKVPANHKPGKGERIVKLYEWEEVWTGKGPAYGKLIWVFHIVRQDSDGTWSAKGGQGPIFEKIKNPDDHTEEGYGIKPKDWTATVWCGPPITTKPK